MTIQNKPTAEILRQLFLEGLGLPQSYGVSEDGKIIPSVFVRDRRFNYGHTPQLQIEIQSIGSKIFHNQSEVDESGVENRTVGTRELLQVVITSEDRSAEERKHEIISLLSSQLSLRLQEKWNIQLAVIPESVNTFSTPSGPYAIFRTVITIVSLSMKLYTSQAETFDVVNYNPNINNIDNTDIITINLTQKEVK